MRRLIVGPVRKRLPTGGVTIALVGGDGAGKSTAVEGVGAWLSSTFETRTVHLGKPQKSALTVVVKGAMYLLRKVGLFSSTRVPPYDPADGKPPVFPGYAWLVWHVLTARDRYLLFRRAQRFVARGGIVVCDRYPLPQVRLMDGERTTWIERVPDLGRPARALTRRERSYYERITPPEVLLVLRVNPDVAVARKVEEEPDHVRPRSEEIWSVDWQHTDAVVIDGARPAADVLAQIRSEVWARL